MPDEKLARLYEIRDKMKALDVTLRRLGPLPPTVAEAARSSGLTTEFMIRLRETGVGDDRKAAFALLDSEFGSAPRAWRDRVAVVITKAIPAA